MPKAMSADDVMPSQFARYSLTYIQQGNSETLRVPNQNKFYVVREEKQDSQILDAFILASFDNEQDAIKFKNQK